MGGRGSSGGYSNASVSSLEKMLHVQEGKMREAQAFAHQTIRSNTAAVIARKIRADTKKYDAAFEEAKKIEKAIKTAKRRRRSEPLF